MTSERVEGPFNTDGLEFLEGDIESLLVMEWHPLPDGEGDPTQVHFMVTVAGLNMPLVLRFKGPRTLDKVIAALVVHRQNVWGVD